MEFEVRTTPTLLKLSRGSGIARADPGTLWDVLPALSAAWILGHFVGKC